MLESLVLLPANLLQGSAVLLIFSPIFVLLNRRSTALAAATAIVASALALFPFGAGGVSLVMQLRGLFAELSMTTVFLLMLWPALRFYQVRLNAADSFWLCAVVLLFALALYPMALGVGAVDSYALGFRPLLLLTLIAGLGVLAAGFKLWVCAVAVALVLTGYWFRVLDSQNLWDYAIDPIVAMFAVVYLLRRVRHRFRPPSTA
jgi:hypothetical protein